jgi:hypothetical protein
MKSVSEKGSHHGGKIKYLSLVCLIGHLALESPARICLINLQLNEEKI